jgi:glycerol-3-phosphate cytidylyltransferase
MRNALVIGGSNGLGLSLAIRLSKENFENIFIVDRNPPKYECGKFSFISANLLTTDYTFIYDIIDFIDTVYITAGIGRLSFFSDIIFPEIDINFKVNTLPTIKLTKIFYHKLKSSKKFSFVVVSSISGFVSSPLYALYSATKSSLVNFISSINAELEYHGTENRILNVAPGKISGTQFHGGQTNLDLLQDLANEIYIKSILNIPLFIPDYSNIYKEVLERNFKDSEKYSRESLTYKLKNNILEPIPKIKVGYMSGTFDLFHIGHLNLIKKAKEYCDYLIVGVHKDASHKNAETVISFEERVEIIKSIKYVDKVIESKREDSDVYNFEKYDYLFVGSDYKGTDRFLKYEKELTPKGVEIVYFPYTKGTSSSKLRQVIELIVAKK